MKKVISLALLSTGLFLIIGCSSHPTTDSVDSTSVPTVQRSLEEPTPQADSGLPASIQSEAPVVTPVPATEEQPAVILEQPATEDTVQ
ncbi:superantigen-like protein SSL4 [Acinetobacter larvae]|uniref:Internalin n=1 Tax=Acinetobacter larvae TaxID=1789224 RepID=A0A1B2LVK7_9GAMM|nr:hypothetical protein [Acinetobacter larvae]AOA56956.1 hypothetical protein BFG52_00320 [Acinetobacter larvae]